MEAATFSSRKKPPPPPPPTTSYSKTATNAGGGGYFATSYDDVFGGPPKFASSTALAPRAEDYTEIFGGFRTSSSSRASSSIPVLDLPVANGGEFDSVFDYSDVFGGINAVDFAVPFDELFRSSDGFDASDDDDAAWTPVGTESLSDDSDPFAFSEKSQCFMNGSSSQPLEAKQFNVSYHKVSPGTSTCVPDTMHVAQINDVHVPVYTCVVEESTSSRESGKERFCSQSVEDIVFSMEAPPIITQKHVKKTMSHLPHKGAGLKSFDGDPRSGRVHSVSMSHVNSILPSDISLPTKSSPISPQSTDSRPSPKSTGRNRGLSGLSSGPQGSENDGFKAAVDSGSPAFFDMEVDVTSSAAASAAAMKDVMEKAQAKLKAAREFRGRKDTLRNGEKVSSETDVNGEGSAEIAHNESVSVENRLHSTNDRGTSKTKSSSKARHGKNGSQILQDTCAAEQPVGVNEQSAGMKHSLPMDTASPDVAGEWKEARQYFEFVNNDNSRSSHQPLSNSHVKDATVKQHNNNGNSIYQPPSTDDKKNATVKQQENNDNDSDSAGESCVTQTNRRRLKATKAVSRQGYYEKMVKVAQEVHDTVTSGHAQISEGLQDTFSGDSKEQRPKLVVEPEKNEGRSWENHRAESEYAEVIKAEADINSKNNIEIGTMHNRETGASYRDVNGIITNDPLLNMDKEAVNISQGERRVKGSYASEESERRVHGEIDIEAHEQSTEALEQRMDKETRAWKDKRSKEAFQVVFDGERQQTECDSKEKDKTQDVLLMKADGFARKTVGRSCEVHKNCKATEFQLLDKHEEHLEKSTCGQGPEKMLHQNVELEKCWEYLEDLEQENSKLNPDMGHKLVDQDNSADSWKQNEREEKLEQTAEQENIQSMFQQAGEVGEPVNVNEKTDLNGDQNAACRDHVEAEWKAEEQQSHISSVTEIFASNEHLKVPNGKDVEPCQLKLPHMKAHGFLNVSAVRENDESGTTLIDKIKLKGIDTSDLEIDTSDLEIDAKEMRFSATQVGADDEEVEGKAVHPLKMPQMKTNGSVDLSAEKENSDVGTVSFDESTSKAVETNDVIDERETVLSAAQEDPSHDELETRAVHMNNNYTKSGEDLIRDDKVPIQDDKKRAQSVSDPKLVKASHLDRGMLRNQGMGQGLRGQEQNTRPVQSERISGWNEHPKKRVGAHPVIPDKKENFLKSSQYPCLSQSIERKGKSIDHNGSLEEKNERKGDLEKDHLRKLEEEKEREREREKDRMAVEVAIREARERAYADARDRAERASLERATEQVRQRTMAEARERLEKASAEVRERSFSDKASEARLRADRAAVDQATADARQRAFEKAMADRAMSETRERMQRSVSEKYTSERDVVMRQSSFPSTSDRFQTANGEPAERCKARLERHRRTVDRVAKALAEKNMRDLVAQREQAERNRFAETLDADIKRWSNGKAGNLRALLSTLQYILGPDSGWQPIPLTEVITAAAVKKAYRKATLCVHPDKLQQRGASVQQKYICEKVFDLLKEAWNRFNSEEK